MAVYRRGRPPEKLRRPPRPRVPFFKGNAPSCQAGQPARRVIDWDRLHILQFSRTPVAGVPIVLRDCFNKYTAHQCKALMAGAGYRDGRRWGPPDALLRDARAAIQLIEWADVVMIHNGHVPKNLERHLRGKRAICYYHSEPHRVNRDLERRGIPAYVIAQGHALLYKRPVLPNVVDIDDELLKPDENRSQPWRIGYAPSNRHSYETECARKNLYSSKGFPEVQRPLRELQDMGVKVHTFEGVPYERCLQTRKQLHFMLDEVVTGSYHRCTLEACAQGQVAINAVSPEVEALVLEFSGGEKPPWLRATPESLVPEVTQLIADPQRLAERMAASRAWMENHWHPRRLLNHFYLAALRNSRVLQ